MTEEPRPRRTRTRASQPALPATRSAAAAPRRSPAAGDRQRDADRSRRLILDAAVAEFAEKGFAGARVSEIAARAGVNKQLISYYFGGKDGLARAIGQRWRGMQDELSAPHQSLPEMITAYGWASFRARQMTRLIAWEGLADRGPESDVDGAERTARFQHEVQALRERQRAGELASDLDPGCVLLALLAATAAPVTLPQMARSICGGEPDSERFMAHYVDQLARLVRHLGGSAQDHPAHRQPQPS